MGLASRLVEVVTGLGALSVDDLLLRVCQGATELLGSQGAGFCQVDGDDLVVAATWQLPEGIVGERFPVAGSAVEALVWQGRRSLLADAADYPALNAEVYQGELGGLAVARTDAAGRLTGALYVRLLPGQQLSSEQLDVLDLLAAHAGVALHDAARLAEAERLRRQTEEAKDLFLAVAGHELRTPLTVLRGFGDTLLHRWDALSDDQRRELVETMVARAGAMALVVEQIVRGSQAGAATVEVQRLPFDLAAEVRRVVHAVDGSSPAHPMALRATGPVPALGDPALVEPVVGQLLENAVKYTPDGGPVEVTVEVDGEEAVARVADRGVGIAQEDLSRVFDRFVRGAPAEGDPGHRTGGVGLGLWIVRRYVEAQGGRVRAGLRDGGGTEVEVRLPRGR